MRKYGLIITLANNPLTSELMINAKDEKLAYIANGVLPTGIKTLGEQRKEKASKEIQIDKKKRNMIHWSSSGYEICFKMPAEEQEHEW